MVAETVAGHEATHRGPHGAVNKDVREAVADRIRAGAPNKVIEVELGVSSYLIKEVAKSIGVYRGAMGRLLTKEEYDRQAALRARKLREGARRRKSLVADVASDFDESNKNKLLAKIVRHGPFATLRDLTSASHDWPDVRLGGHEIEHLVRSLQRNGKLSYRESANAPGGLTLRRIMATPDGVNLVRAMEARRATGNQNEKPNGKQPSSFASYRQPIERRGVEGAEVVETTEAAAAEPADETQDAQDVADMEQAHAEVVDQLDREIVTLEGQEWPLLRELRAKVSLRVEAERKAETYMRAASLLEEIGDQPEADRLTRIAADAVEAYRLSRIEDEYLRYADACPAPEAGS